VVVEEMVQVKVLVLMVDAVAEVLKESVGSLLV
jgi:hypothetical protein